MAVLFAFVAIWGSMAHACEGKHHAHGAELVSVSVASDEAAAGLEDNNSPTSEPQTHKGKGTHPCCADLQCHGVAAILSSAAMTAPSQSGAKVLGIPNYGREVLLGSSLDRPPRTAVQI